MHTLTRLILWGGLFCGGHLSAQSIILQQAREAPIPIAIQSFLKKEETEIVTKRTTDIEAMLTADLIFSRLFKVLPADSFLEPKVKGSIDSFQVDPWKQINAQLVVRGRIEALTDRTKLEAYVFDVVKAKVTLQKTYETSRADYSLLAHQLGDDIVELVTGQKGLFSTKVAFSYKPPKSRYREIWLMDFNGRNAVPLVQNGRTNLSPAWTPDGRYIYYTSSTTIDWHLWRVDLNGRQTQITKFPGSALGPDVLPNGRELVVSLSKDGNSELYLLDLEGKVKKRLTKNRFIDISPSVSPDGKFLCFSSDRLGNLHIFRLDLSSLEDFRLTRVGTLNDSCAWNSKENLIYFSGMDTDREFDIFGMNEAGVNMERLTYDAKHNESPSWSPDGKLLAFSSRRSVGKQGIGENQIIVMKADGTQASPIVDLAGDAIQPAWSPRLGY